MARPEVTGRKPIHADAADPADAYSVEEFCRRHRISAQLFYKLRPLGLMPTTFNVGARVLISREAAAAWRHARENQHGRDPPDLPTPVNEKIGSPNLPARQKKGIKR